MKLKLRLSTVLKCFVVSALILSSLVSLRLGGLPSITLPRVLLVISYLWIIFTPDRQRAFIGTVRKCNYNGPILIYLLICLYTALLRGDINTFFGFFVDCYLVCYLLLYILRYYLSIDDFIRIITICMYIVCILGLVEFLTGFNVFTELAIGETDVIATSYRDSMLRVRGPYGHALAYGMVLLIFFPLTCYSHKENSINIFKNEMLFILVVLNMFFTGARSGIGLFGIELILLYIFTSKKYKGRAIFTVAVLIIAVFGIVVLLSNTTLVQYCLRQVFYVVDEIFDTDISVLYGGDRSISASSMARDRIWKILYDQTLNPWLGRGTSNIGTFMIDNWRVTSIDNFYVRTYVSLGFPGLISLLFLDITFIIKNLKMLIKSKNVGYGICLISSGLHIINLIYVDELATFKYFFLLISISTAISMKLKEGVDDHTVRSFDIS